MLNRESIADLYDLLAIALKCPDRTFLEGLSDGAIQSDLMAITEELGWEEMRPQLSGEWEIITTWVAELNEDAFFSKLRAEYTRLFVTPKTAEIPIHESIFLIKPGKMPDLGPLLMRSPAALDAKTCYRKAGLELTEVASADHMAMELEFMAYLWRHCEEETFAEQKAYFEEKHMKKWMESFFAQCEAKTRHPFYRIVGVLGQELARQTLH